MHMASFDIVGFIQNNISTITSSAQVVACGVVSAMFLRKKTSIETGTKAFEKIKAAKLGEAAEELLDSGRITYTEFWKMKNYSDIAKKADELRTEQTEEILPQDFDWHTRFYEACGSISDDEIQEIWAAVLSGEISNPGSYSLRTLECLRNISKEEAKLFKKVCDCSVLIGGSVILPKFGGIMEENGITYDDVIKLDDCGLIKSDVGMSIGMPVNSKYSILTTDDKHALLVRLREGSSKKRLDLMDYLFTATGKELYSIVGSKTSIEDFCKILQSEYQEFDFALGQIVNREGNHITYSIMTLSVSKTE